MSLKVVVLDMQPIDPPVGGGRIRLLGLYHGLGEGFQTTYVGTYDWPGPGYRNHWLSKTLQEINIPLSDDHFKKNEELNKRIPGKTIIDVTFPILVQHSPELVEEAKKQVQSADIVIFSHPWLFPCVENVIDFAQQLVVYDSHNCEGFLRTALLDDGGYGTELARNVVSLEHEICHKSDLILACSNEDKDMFSRFYKVNKDKIRVVPNGVFTSKIQPSFEARKREIKKNLGLEGFVVVFIASNYPPNVEAAKIIIDQVAPSLPGVNFVIIGGVGDAIPVNAIKYQNIKITGFVEEDVKLEYLACADAAINPMVSGSGTNIKMFDFMAAGLPVVTTPIGGRGIKNPSGYAFIVCDVNELSSKIEQLICDSDFYTRVSREAQQVVQEKYSWEKISPKLGIILRNSIKYKRLGTPPFFSVIVPTYNRHDHLEFLVNLLKKQTDQDFELIIVDQSDNKWANINQLNNLNYVYYYTQVKGAVKARNTGLELASGKVIAFIDDDCQPYPNWLENARKYFEDKNVVGVEGLIKSCKLDDPYYRTVTNEGFEGIGFMTANLFVRKTILDYIDGFDERFDNPHFREDTDLGWRVQEYGAIPFGNDVIVYHPPHKRDIKRESLEERAKFFVHDPLLLKKHSAKYVDLFVKEGHYKKTEGFWDYFREGIKRHDLCIEEVIHMLSVDPRIDVEFISKCLRYRK